MPSETFAPRDHNIASEDFDGEFVVLDLKSGRYFSLPGSSAIVWRALLAGHSVQSLSSGLPSGDSRVAEVSAFVETLVGYDLLTPTNVTTTPSDDLPGELARSSGGFTIDMFDDLADLLVADPIHDVDVEMGWPHRPAGTA